MFTLTDTPVKFVGLLILFSFSTLWSLYQLARRQSGPTLVSNLAHLAMSLVMLVMVPNALWQPFSAAIPLPGLVGFFGMFAVWFGYLGVRGLAGGGGARQHGWHAFGHAGMFGAMTWHLAAMLSHHTPGGHPAGAGGVERVSTEHAQMDHATMDHATMGHTAMDPAMTDHAVGAGGTGMLIAIIGVPLMTYLLVAAAGNLKNALVPSSDIQDRAGHAAAGHGHYAAGNPRLAALADCAMNFGMFWMSTGLMVPLLPFFGSF